MSCWQIRPNGQVHAHVPHGPGGECKICSCLNYVKLFSHEIIRQTFLAHGWQPTKSYLDWYSSYGAFFPRLPGVDEVPITNHTCL